MLSGNDIALLVFLVERGDDDWTYRSLAEKLGSDHVSVHRSVGRLREAGLLDDERKPIRGDVEEFLIHALRYLQPVALGPVGRGLPTAWGAPPLVNELAPSDEPPPVWPRAAGSARGPILEPLSDLAVRLADGDDHLREWFSLLDAVRVGRARERRLAADQISDRIWARAGN